jgi:phosphocarrier protein
MDALCRRVVVVNKRGLHARAAARFVKVAERFGAEVTVSVVDDGEGGCRQRDAAVSARSIMGLMMLAASPGTQLDLTATGPDAPIALAALVELVDRRFDEEE